MNFFKNFYNDYIVPFVLGCFGRHSEPTPALVIGAPTDFRKEATPYTSMTNLTDEQADLLRQANVAELSANYPNQPIEMQRFADSGKTGTAGGEGGLSGVDL